MLETKSHVLLGHIVGHTFSDDDKYIVMKVAFHSGCGVQTIDCRYTNYNGLECTIARYQRNLCQMTFTGEWDFSAQMFTAHTYHAIGGLPTGPSNYSHTRKRPRIDPVTDSLGYVVGHGWRAPIIKGELSVAVTDLADVVDRAILVTVIHRGKEIAEMRVPKSAKGEYFLTAANKIEY